MKKLKALIVAPFILTACVAVGPQKYDQFMSEKVTKKSSFDFICPQHKLTITLIDTSTYGVTGCGKRGTYVARDVYCNPDNSMSNLKKFCIVVPDTFGEANQ